jgi:CheY-like chemotaxis protein
MKQILIIEDDEIVARLFALFAKRQFKRANVTIANTADDALSLLLHNKYDYIVCDIELPKISGPKILIQRELHDAKIIFVSALSKYEDELEPCYQKGINILAFKQKPIFEKDFQALLK